MNLLDQRLMLAPSCTPGYCIVCGRPYPTKHHPVKRSHGGHDGPELHLCGHGTRGCHGKAEVRRLHFDYDFDACRWIYVETLAPMKYALALGLPGWRVCRDSEPDAC